MQQRGTGLPRMSRGTREIANVMSRSAFGPLGTVPLLSEDNDKLSGNAVNLYYWLHCIPILWGLNGCAPVTNYGACTFFGVWLLADAVTLPLL